ncbi:predicted protein [Naegleria gruberi]|uniref:Predicted protein n=1 Tax=Naegleria gruberi TaxID=5762 RepID=D2VSX1_NAEGR|nr:uncharacterized protein NAEGRDRAFT_81116 [Naegleria gruberi]EFC39977.1 predicted protein [Naegleria gruberi]|eukprot:XP_002672721.1 predicted protein [Naegleria gruberi strain NEG-M]
MSNNPYGSTDVDPYDYDYQPNYGNPTQGYVPPQVGAMSQPAQINIEPVGSMDNEALRLKAMELARREAELEKREQEVTNLDNANTAKKNFPRCYPLVYHNIADVPNEFLRRKIAYWGFISAIVFQVVVFLNCVSAYITAFSTTPNAFPKDVSLMNLIQFCIVSTILFLISGIAHFFLGYWPLYKAMDTGAIPRFIIFFIAYAVSIIFCALGVAGYLTYGFSGIVTAIYYFPTGTYGSIAGFVCNLIMAVIWFALMINYIIIFIMVIKVFRALKGSLNKIKEYGAGLVQSGAATAISSAVKNTISGGGSQQV